MINKINIDKSVEKELKRVNADTRKRLLNGITGLLEEPPIGDIKPLKGELKGLNRLRVGNWRVIYEKLNDAINIIEVSPRGGAYK